MTELSATRSRALLTPLAFCYGIAYLLWATVGSASPQARAFASESVFLPLNIALLVVNLLAARNAAQPRAFRRALFLLAAADAALVAGNAAAVIALVANGRAVNHTLIDLLYLAGYPLNLLALISIPGARRSSDRWKLLCDAGMVLSGCGVALWYFVLRPLATPATDYTTIALAMVFPLSDLLLLVGMVTVLFRQPADGNRGAIRWLAIGMALGVVADLSYNLLVVSTGQRAPLWRDAAYLANTLALLRSAELFSRGPDLRERPPSDAFAHRARQVLPLAAAGTTYLLLLVIALRQWVAPLSGVALGSLAVSLFLGARQLLAFRRNAERAAEAAVRASEARFRSLVQHSSDLIFLLDEHGLIQFASSSASRVIGYESEALVGVELAALAHRDEASLVTGFMELAAEIPGLSPAAEFSLVRPDGDIVLVEAVATNMLADPAVRGIVLNARDVGERKTLLDQLAHQAFHDPLTGLANRALFYDRASHALQLAARQGTAVFVVYLDLDDFKQVNDTLGHAEGDRLLTLVAARLRTCARDADTVARLGGDEFAILVEDADAQVSGAALIARIREQMAYPFALAGAEVRASASVGSAVAHGGAVDDILRHADLAMYAAKRAEKGSHRTYSEIAPG